MNTSGEVADLMVKEGIQITESAIKLTGLGVKNLAALVIALANDNIKLQGKTNIKNLIKSDKPLCILQINESDIAKFNTEAKKYGVLFTAITDKTNKTDKCDIIAKQEDAAKLNYILEQKLGYVAPVQDTEPEKEAEAPEQENTTPERDGKVQNKAQEENEKNAQTRQSESEKVSDSSSKKYGNIENTDNPIDHRPSVRKKVEDIKEQRAKAKADKEPVKAPQHEQSQKPRGKGKKNKNKSQKGKNKGR